MTPANRVSNLEWGIWSGSTRLYNYQVPIRVRKGDQTGCLHARRVAPGCPSLVSACGSVRARRSPDSGLRAAIFLLKTINRVLAIIFQHGPLLPTQSEFGACYT